MQKEEIIRFSIVIPLYNKETVISRTLQSVLKQSYSNYEVVVVDDGSKDRSIDIVSSYDDSRIRIINQENKGVSAARNRGIRESRYEWIFFLDADDLMLPNALSVFADMIKSYPNEKYFSARSLWENHIEGDDVIAKSVRRTRCPFFYIWLRKIDPAPRNVVIHRDLIDKLGFYDERMSFYEDWEFSLRMCRVGTVVYTNQFVAQYMPGPQGLSQKKHPHQKEMAYYFPEMKSKMCFWEKALWYENIEQVIFSWQNDEAVSSLYRGYENRYFSRIHKSLHWMHQQFIRHKII